MIDVKKLTEKFFTDPDWSMMEELLRSYIDPLQFVNTIDAGMSNDEIATEVRGRQLAYKGLDDFLTQSGVLKPRVSNDKPNFR